MADTNFPLSAEDGHDDLPRTFRREKEARAREAAEREAASSDAGYQPAHSTAMGTIDDDIGVPATVKRFDVPFFSLMFFFLKAVLAGIPALLLLGVIIWFAGELAQTYLPWLVKMQIFIHFPD